MQSIFDLVEEAIDTMANTVKQAAPVIAGEGVPMAVIALAGDVDISVMDISSRLATPEMGSVFGGVLAVGLIGISSYYSIKKLFAR